MCVHVREGECVCSCERGREREKVCGVYVCVRVREGECVCSCERGRVCVFV